MALIHEGIGTVVDDPTGTFQKGSSVVIIPNKPFEQNEYIAENYLYSSKFSASSCDGFMQEYMTLDPLQVVALPESVDKNVAAFTELISVVAHAISRFEGIAHESRRALGIWGDGNVGYIASLLIHMLYPDTDIYVVGRNTHKLNDFTFARGTFLVGDVAELPPLDHAFECCGGEGSAPAIDQIIDAINPEGTISLLGVSENKVPINTRMVLEKGLRLYGSSRSGREDFLQTVQWYEQYPVMVEYLSSLVGSVVEVQSVPDIVAAFESDKKKSMGKTVMHWNM
jgi:ribitol-5-phosphate 2-dehydrogenase